jgi:rRNA maturation RNase YbeY
VEDLNPAWPETGGEESGIFFTTHEVDFEIPEHEHLHTWIRQTVEAEGGELNRIDFVFCSDPFLLEMNRVHLGHDTYTDIITFPLNTNPLMAEIYISVDRVNENATQLHIPFDEELRRVMIHGVLHLLGYDDHAEEDIRIIREKEASYLKTYTDRAG